MKIFIILSALVALSVASSQSRNSLFSSSLNSNQQLQSNDADNVAVNLNSRRRYYNPSSFSNQQLQSNILGVNAADNVAVNRNSRRQNDNLDFLSNILGVNDADNVAVNRNSRRRNNYQSSFSNQQLQSNVLGINTADNFAVNPNSRRQNDNQCSNLRQLRYNIIDVNDRNKPYSRSNQLRSNVVGLDEADDVAFQYNQRQNAVRRLQNDDPYVLCMCAPEDPAICGSDGRVYYGVCQFNCGLTLNPGLRIVGSVPCLQYLI